MTGTSKPIIVEGYTPRYRVAVNKLLGIEGGYVNDPVDRGGATKYGISLRFLVTEGKIDADGDGLADFDLDMDGDIDGRDIRQLTIGDAVWLYYECFWKRGGIEQLPEPIGEMVFDQGVNGGLKAAKKMLQRALNAVLREHRYRTIPLQVDGAIGEKTLSVLESMVARHGVQEIAQAYREAAKDRYLAIVRANPSQGRFIKGWLRRAEELGRA